MKHLKYVEEAVADIESMAGDDEAAHTKEDQLYYEILKLIAEGALSGEDAVLCAKEALKTVEIDFARWCA